MADDLCPEALAEIKVKLRSSVGMSDDDKPCESMSKSLIRSDLINSDHERSTPRKLLKTQGSQNS